MRALHTAATGMQAQELDTHHKTLKINLEPRWYGTLAEIGAGQQFLPVGPQSGVTSTDVMTTASGLLRAADLQVFELGMWQSWTGR